MLRPRYMPFAFLLLLASGVTADDSPRKEPPVRTILHGTMSPEPPTEKFLSFVERIKPDVVITGAFDQRLYATAMPADKKTAGRDPEITDGPKHARNSALLGPRRVVGGVTAGKRVRNPPMGNMNRP